MKRGASRIETVARAMKKMRNFLIVPHVNIDGDELGSMVTLKFALEAMDKSVALFTPDAIPQMFTFLPGLESISEVPPQGPFDAAILIECSTPNRIPPGVKIKDLCGKLINVDHHPDNKFYGDYNLVDPGAAAVGEIIYYLIRGLGVTLDERMACGLYVAILTDTGSFQYSNVTRRTHRIVAELLRHPLDVATISRKIYRENSLELMRLQGMVLAGIKSTCAGRIVWGTLTSKMLQETGVSQEDTQGIIEEMNQIRGSEVVVLFKETDRAVRVSFRSNRFPVNVIADRFNGGGHRQASGCTLEVDLETAQKTVLQALTEAITECNYK